MLFPKYTFLFSGILLFNCYTIAQETSQKVLQTPTDSIEVPTDSYVLQTVTDSVVNYGKLFLNTPYRYGSKGANSFDCSGFTSYVYRNFGYNLGSSSSDQAQQFDTITKQNLRKGDLVFFSGRRHGKSVGHVGIVVASKENGEFDFIHAAVRSGVIISNSQEDYYLRRYIKAGRVVPDSQLFAYHPKPVSLTPQVQPVLTETSQTTLPNEVVPRYHTVKSRETLSGIASNYGLTVAQLKRLNNINGNNININQRLKVNALTDQPVIASSGVLPSNSIPSTEVKNSFNPPVEVAHSKPQTHVVGKGETLFSIAKKYDVPVDELKKMNRLAADKVLLGQKLTISTTDNNTFATAAEPVIKNTPTESAISQNTKTYIVKSGESLLSIATKNNTTVSAIKKLNNLQTNNIQVGKKLEILIAETQKPVSTQSEVKTQTIGLVEIENPINYTVKQGDNLTAIAKANQLTVEEVLAINNLKSRIIHTGQVLVLPSEAKPLASSAAMNDKKQVSTVSEKVSTKTYVVKSGDNLSSIAETQQVSFAKLKALNHLTGSQIQVGQKLRLPESLIETIATEKSEQPTKDIAHKVKPGDSYYSIAKKYRCSTSEIKNWNNKSSNQVNIGDVLIIHQAAN